MKQVIKSIAVTAAASGMLLASSAFAADQKFAVVNFQEVMAKVPQAATFMQSLEAEFKDEQAAVMQLEKDLKYFSEKRERDSAIMSAKEKEDLEKQIAETYQKYQQQGKALQQQVTIRQNEERNKLFALIQQAVANIAAKEKYDMVIEQKAAIFSKPELNITDDVVQVVSKLK